MPKAPLREFESLRDQPLDVAPITREVAEASKQKPTPICNCGATERHATYPDICPRGHTLVGNQKRRTNGARAFEARGDAAVPETLRQSADAMAAGIIADKGGIENVSTLMKEAIMQARNVRVMLDLLGNDLIVNGLFTNKRHVRTTFNRWLETLDRFDRFATKIGVDRESRTVTDLRTYLATAKQSPTEASND